MVRNKNVGAGAANAQHTNDRNEQEETGNGDSQDPSDMAYIANVNKSVGNRKKGNVKEETVKRTRNRVVSKATFTEGDETVNMELEVYSLTHPPHPNYNLFPFVFQKLEIAVGLGLSSNNFQGHPQVPVFVYHPAVN